MRDDKEDSNMGRAKIIIGYLDEHHNINYLYRKPGECQQTYRTRMGRIRDEAFSDMTGKQKQMLEELLTAVETYETVGI
jgi:hypothetical protein